MVDREIRLSSFMLSSSRDSHVTKSYFQQVAVERPRADDCHDGTTSSYEVPLTSTGRWRVSAWGTWEDGSFVGITYSLKGSFPRSGARHATDTEDGIFRYNPVQMVGPGPVIKRRSYSTMLTISQP